MTATAKPSTIRHAVDWLFRDRRTGRIVVAQLPNVPLTIFLGASVVRRFGDPEGDARTLVAVVAMASLVWWASDEILRGVNPFRRALGAVALAVTVASWLRG